MDKKVKYFDGQIGCWLSYGRPTGVVMVKVNVVNAPETVTNHELYKQDCVVANSSGNCRVVLWEQDVCKMEEKTSYKLVAVIK